MGIELFRKSSHNNFLFIRWGMSALFGGFILANDYLKRAMDDHWEQDLRNLPALLYPLGLFGLGLLNL